MKFRNILLVLFILVICCGCSVEYNLDIDNYLNLDESITMSVNSNNEILKIKSYDTFLPISVDADEPSIFETKKDGVDYYDITKSSDDSEIKFEYTYDVDKFNDNVFARTCYQYVTVMDSYNKEELRNELLLSTSKKFLCFDSQEDLDSVTIKIHTKREVYSSNADSVDGDTYIWTITESNKDDAAISMVLSSDIEEEKVSFWEKNLLFIIVLGVLVICGIVYLLMKKHSEKVDKI